MNAKRVAVGEWAAGPVGAVVGVDFETFYSSAYSVNQTGNWAYVHDERFSAWAVSVSDGERTCVCPPGEFPWATIEGRDWVSHNREFDRAVYERLKSESGRCSTINTYGEGPRRWWCSAAACAFLQYPRDLAGAAGAVLGVEVDKRPRALAKGLRRGADLFGLPEADAAYAATDAEVAMALWRELEGRWPAHERRLYDLTCEAGRRGVMVDWDHVGANLNDLYETIEGVGGSLPWRPALSLTRFGEACDRIGAPRPRSTATGDAWFQAWVKDNPHSEAVTWARHMQRIRSANRTAKVLEGMLARRKPDGRMAYELKYFGASTGRWAGGGGLNMQNFNRKPAEGVDLRRCIVAPEGCRLAVVDYSQIESRVLLFLAGDVDALELFRRSPEADAYEIHARATMGYAEAEPLREYCERTGSGLRQLAKARVLGLGFGCGARRFVEVAKTMAGLDIGEAESERIVKEFRESNPRIPALWQRLNDACAARDGGDYLLALPCTQANPELGRFLIYRDVAAGMEGIACTVCGERIKVYGGLLAENWTQATARDVLASAWLRCDAAGYKAVLSVHDELVFEVPGATAAEDLGRIVAILEEPLPWALGLPLRVDAKLCDVYGK